MHALIRSSEDYCSIMLREIFVRNFPRRSSRNSTEFNSLDVCSPGFGVRGSFGGRDTNGWVPAPYAGVRRAETRRSRYTETAPDTFIDHLGYQQTG